LLVLIVKKLKKDSYIYIDYYLFNAFIIKNCNTLLLIRDTFVRLYTIKFYIKFNIIATFNKICIYKNNKYKIVFII